MRLNSTPGTPPRNACAVASPAKIDGPSAASQNVRRVDTGTSELEAGHERHVGRMGTADGRGSFVQRLRWVPRGSARLTDRVSTIANRAAERCRTEGGCRAERRRGDP